MPLPARSAREVVMERLPYDLLQGRPGRQMFAEAHRVLIGRGAVRGETGVRGNPGAIRQALKAVGFKQIRVEYDQGGGISFSAVKP